MNDANRTQAMPMDPNRTRMGAPPAVDPNRTMMGGPPVASNTKADATQTIKPVQCPICKTFNPAGVPFCVDCGLIFDRALPADAFGAPAIQLPKLVDKSGREYPLRPGENTVGREGDVLIAEGRASRRHAKVTLGADGSLSIEDLGSTNGTKVDGAALTAGQPRSLQGTETISFAGFEMVVSLPGTAGGNATQALAGGKTQAFQPSKTQAMVAPPRTEAAPAKLVGTDGTEHPLRAGTTVFGRRDGNDLRLTDDYVSGRHGQFEIGADGIFLTDLGSSNGTFIDDAKLQPNTKTRVSPGARVKIGRIEFKLL